MPVIGRRDELGHDPLRPASLAARSRCRRPGGVRLRKRRSGPFGLFNALRSWACPPSAFIVRSSLSSDEDRAGAGPRFPDTTGTGWLGGHVAEGAMAVGGRGVRPGPCVDVAAEPARGLQGEVWRLTTTTGTWAVKETFGPITEDEARSWGEFQEAARRAGVPAPPVRRTRWPPLISPATGRSGCTAGSTSADRTPDSTRARRGGGGQAAPSRRCRPTGRRTGGTPSRSARRPGTSSWMRVRPRARRSPSGWPRIRDDLVALEMDHDPDGARTAVPSRPLGRQRPPHGGGVVSASSTGTTAARPIRAASWLWCCSSSLARTRPEGGDARGVSISGGPGRLRETADFAMLAAQLGHIVAMHLRRWLDPASSEPTRQRALVGIEEFVDSALTPTVVRTILDAIS